jgi:hypothetical protein
MNLHESPLRKIVKFEILLSLFVFGVLLLFDFTTNTTGDSGDSITHYLYSHYAFDYPEFFLHHWAKPLFVFLSAPFSYFGFKGILVFNSLCATLSALFAYYTSRNLKLKNSLLVFVFILFSPLYFKLIFSGLTEYLFGLFLIIGVYLVSKSKLRAALIIVSFLPLIRSEGLIILGVFGLYVLLKKEYKNIPYLLTGQFVYTLVGAFFYKDLLWVFNQIPYANLGSPYGSGGPFDFLHRLNYVIEKPTYLLLIAGALALIYSLFRFGLKKDNDVKVILILGSVAAIFLAHSMFWWLGIFNSMGLARVLITVVPLIAIVAVVGLEKLTSGMKIKRIRHTILFIIVLSVCFYPFSYREEGVVFNKNLFVLQENKLVDEELAPFLEQQFPDYGNRTLYFSHPYLSLALDIDYFDSSAHREMQFLSRDKLKAGSLVIWDDWFSLIEGGVKEEQLISDDRFELIQGFSRKESNRMIKYSLFKIIREGERNSR